MRKIIYFVSGSVLLFIILMGLILPLLGRAKNKNEYIESRQNMRAIEQAIISYCDNYNECPPNLKTLVDIGLLGKQKLLSFNKIPKISGNFSFLSSEKPVSEQFLYYRNSIENNSEQQIILADPYANRFGDNERYVLFGGQDKNKKFNCNLISIKESAFQEKIKKQGQGEYPRCAEIQMRD